MGNKTWEELYKGFETEGKIFHDPAMQGGYDLAYGLSMLLLMLCLLIVELCLTAKEKAKKELETWPKHTNKSLLELQNQQKEAQLLHQRANYFQKKIKEQQNPQGQLELGKFLLNETIEFQKKYMASDFGLGKTIETLQQQLGSLVKKNTDTSTEEQDKGKAAGSPDLKPRRMKL